MNIYTNRLTHLPPLTHTFLHLYSLSFMIICTHFSSFVLTSLHLYSLTFTLVPKMWASMTFLPFLCIVRDLNETLKIPLENTLKVTS